MVVVSLYKGNIHKAADVHRRLPSPTPIMSLKDFKTLIRRRDRALSRLSTTSNHDPASDPNSNPDSHNNAVTELGAYNYVGYRCSDSRIMAKVDFKEEEREKQKVVGEIPVEGESCLTKLVGKSDALVVEEAKKDVENLKNDGESEVPIIKAVEKINMGNAVSDVEKRIKEVKEKLEVLNEKKHSLVQILKQILNVEEHLKRQNNTQGMSSHTPTPLQVDNNTTDSGSMIQVNTPRKVKDGNPCGDTNMEGGEADDVSNHNTHSRHLPRMSSF